MDYESEAPVSGEQMVSHLDVLLNYYKQRVSIDVKDESSTVNQTVFYMEKQLEDFIIHNWDNTEFGKNFDLIYEDGELLSQQYRTKLDPSTYLQNIKKTVPTLSLN